MEENKESVVKEEYETSMQNELLALINGDLSENELHERLEDYHDADIAQVFDDLDKKGRLRLYRALGIDRVADVFSYLDEDVTEYFEEIGLEKSADILEEMDADDAVDVLEKLPEEYREQLFERMDDEAQEDINLITSYDDDQVGSLMTTNFIEIHRGISTKEAMRELIRQSDENDNISTIYVTENDGTLYGAIDLKDLIIARQDTDLDSITSVSYPYVYASANIDDEIERLRTYSEDSIPVLDDSNKILGVITPFDVVEAVDDALSEDYARIAGLTAEEDLHETLFDSIKKRIPWLVVLLALGILVSSVVGVFEGVVREISLIICFQSLILDMAGNVGTQSLAVTIRVLMDEALTGGQKFRFVLKEGRVGLTNGLILGLFSFLFVGLYIWLIKQYPPAYSFSIAGCVGLALMLAMFVSSLVGTLVPMFFHKIHVDPALASGPLITTVNDLVAVVTYYGLAWTFLIGVLHITS